MFVDRARRHFQYLIQYYGFSSGEYGTFAGPDDAVVFQNPVCRVRVRREGAEVRVELGPQGPEDGRPTWFSLEEIVRVQHPEPCMDLSDPAWEPWALWSARAADEDERLDRAAHLLREYAAEMLCGDWSLRQELERRYREQQRERARNLVAEAEDLPRPGTLQETLRWAGTLVRRSTPKRQRRTG